MAGRDIRWRMSLDNSAWRSAVGDVLGDFTALSGGAAAAAIGVAAYGAAVAVAATETYEAAKAAVEFAGKVSDLATKTGIGGEALQQLGYAGSLVGTSMEDVGTAVKKLQEHIVKAPEDFKQLGISIEHLKTLDPAKQFEEVARAISSIQDPAQKTAATIAFMGKSGQEAMKLMSLDIAETSERAKELGLIMGDQTREALDALGDSATTLSSTWEHLLMNFGGAIASTPELKALVDDLASGIGDLSVFIQENQDLIQDLTRMAVVPLLEEMRRWISVMRDVAGGFGIIRNKILEVKSAITDNGLIAGAKAFFSGNYSTVAKTPGGSGLSATGSVTGAKWDDPAELKKMEAERAASAKRLAEIEKKHLADVAKAIKEETDTRKHGYDQTVKEMGAFIDSYKAEQERLVKASMGRDQVNAENARLKAETASAMDAIIASVVTENVAKDAALSFGGNFTSGLKSSMSNLPNVILGAIQGGGDVGKAIGSSIGGTIGQSLQKPLTDTLSKALGSSLGGLLGALAPGMGAVLGSAAGSLITNLITNVNAKKGTIIGAVLGGPVGAIVGHFLGGQAESKRVNDMRDQFISAAGGLDALRLKAAQAGMGLEQLLRVSKVKDFEAAVLQLNNAFGSQAAAGEAVNAAMEKYGLTISEMGPKFAQQQLDEQVGQLIKDYEVLRASGADMNAVTAKMGPAMNEYVQQAVAAGIAIPENMRGPLQKMAEMGLLTDEAGNKMENLDGLNFTESLTDGLTRAVDAMELLVKSIGQLLGIGPINIPVHVGEGPSGLTSEKISGSQHSFGSGGVYQGPDGGTARLHKGEGVFTPEQMAALGGGGQQEVMVKLSFDSPEFERFVTARMETGHIKVPGTGPAHARVRS
jgi:hypothetical protein